MKPLWLFALCLCLCVLALASSNAGAQVEACQKQARPGWWSEAENHVWDQTCAGKIANFVKGEKFNLECPCSRVPQRRISWRFLKLILSEKRFREAVTQRGVRIVGGCFPDSINLKNERLPWPLELKQSRFEGRLRLFLLLADRSVSFAYSYFMGDLNMNSVLIKGSLFLENSVFMNKVDLRQARIEGMINMEYTKLNGHLDMDSASIGIHLFMRNLVQDSNKNKIIMRQAKIGGQLDMSESEINGKLDMDSISIGSHLFMREGANFDSEVNLRFATIGLQFSLLGATFQTLDLRGATIGRDFLLSKGDKSVDWKNGGERNGVQLDLRNTKVGTLTASRNSWPGEPSEPCEKKLELRGFTYSRLGKLGENDQDKELEQPVHELLEWLCRDKTFSFQPYQQLADVLRNAGRYGNANKVLFVGRSRERRSETTEWWLRLWLTVLQVVIGYGIGLYTFLVLLWVALFVMIGWVVLRKTKQCLRHCDTHQERIGFWFSLDYLLPVMRLRDAHYEKVTLTSGVRIYFYVHQIIGYILVSFVIAGLTGMTQ